MNRPRLAPRQSIVVRCMFVVCTVALFFTISPTIVFAEGTCPYGYGYNEANDRCEGEPICFTGGYDPGMNSCVNELTVICPSGYSNPSGTAYCEASPDCPDGINCTCPPGGGLAGSGDGYTCIASAVDYICPDGATPNLQYQVCQGPVVCLWKGSFNSTQLRHLHMDSP